jgi:hypothetical protein
MENAKGAYPPRAGPDRPRRDGPAVRRAALERGAAVLDVGALRARDLASTPARLA